MSTVRRVRFRYPDDTNPMWTPRRPEEHEVFEVRWLPLQEAFAMAASGGLEDGKSLVGLFWARERLAADGATPGQGSVPEFP